MCFSPCGTLVSADRLSWLQCLPIPQTDTLTGVHTSTTLKEQTIRTATSWWRQTSAYSEGAALKYSHK